MVEHHGGVSKENLGNCGDLPPPTSRFQSYLTAAAALGKGWGGYDAFYGASGETRDLALFPAILPHLKQRLTQSWYSVNI